MEAVASCVRQIGLVRLKGSQTHTIVEFAVGNDVFMCLQMGYGKCLLRLAPISVRLSATTKRVYCLIYITADIPYDGTEG